MQLINNRHATTVRLPQMPTVSPAALTPEPGKTSAERRRASCRQGTARQRERSVPQGRERTTRECPSTKREGTSEDVQEAREEKREEEGGTLPSAGCAQFAECACRKTMAGA
ncbi:unnamed protein product [Ixodes persulcatus]